jgi:hypothetical protein
VTGTGHEVGTLQMLIDFVTLDAYTSEKLVKTIFIYFSGLLDRCLFLEPVIDIVWLLWDEKWLYLRVLGVFINFVAGLT